MAGKASLQEVEEHWSLEDVLIAHQLIDLQEAVEQKASRELDQSIKKGYR